MKPEHDNPNRSPAEIGLPAGPPASLLRGLLWALPASAAAFVLLITVVSIVAVARHYVFGGARLDMQDDFRELPAKWSWPAIGVAIVFGLATILDVSPVARLGFLRAVICVGLSALVGLFGMAIASALLKLEPRSYTSDPWRWLRILISLAIPVGYTAVHTAIRCRMRNTPGKR